jgi:voltage-gated sodium channel
MSRLADAKRASQVWRASDEGLRNQILAAPPMPGMEGYEGPPLKVDQAIDHFSDEVIQKRIEAINERRKERPPVPEPGTSFLDKWAFYAAKFKENIPETAFFQNIITAVIAVAGVLVGIQTYDLDQSIVQTCAVIDEVILGIFIMEMVVKMIGESPRVDRYFYNAWNQFDFVIVASAVPPLSTVVGGQVMILRLLRLLRVLKLLKAIPQLQMILMGMVGSLSSISYVALLLFMVLYLWAIIGVILFSANDPEYFGTVDRALVSLWQAASGDDWTEIMYTAFWGCDHPSASPHYSDPSLCTDPKGFPGISVIIPTMYFLTFEVFAGLMLVNLFIGVMMVSMEEAKEGMKGGMVIKVGLVRGFDLIAADSELMGGKSDPYVVVTLNGEENKAKQTKKLPNTLNPVWNETLEFNIESSTSPALIKFDVIDHDFVGAHDPIGDVTIDATKLPDSKTFMVDLTLDGVAHGAIRVTLQKIDLQNESVDQKWNPLFMKLSVAQERINRIATELGHKISADKKLRKAELRRVLTDSVIKTASAVVPAAVMRLVLRKKFKKAKTKLKVTRALKGSAKRAHNRAANAVVPAGTLDAAAKGKGKEAKVESVTRVTPFKLEDANDGGAAVVPIAGPPAVSAKKPKADA